MKTPKREMIAIDELFFDSQNPRLPDSMEKSNEAAVLLWMLRNGEILDLMASIATSGFSSAEAVIAIPRKGGGHEVVEGNRRLAAVKLLKNPRLATVRQKSVQSLVDESDKQNIPDKIPTLVYPERADILTYLGYRHITGVKSWGSEEKAKYLKQLYEHYASQGFEDRAIYQIIAKSVATKPLYARKTLATLKLIELAAEKNYWDEENLSEKEIKFSVLGTALGSPSIYHFIGFSEAGDTAQENIDEERVAELFKWLFMPIGSSGNAAVKESRHIPMLAKVLETKEALKNFREGKSLEEAALYTDDAEENFMNLIKKSLNALENAQNYLKIMNKPTTEMVDVLREAHKLARVLGVAVKDLTQDIDDDSF